jgi:DNA-binding MarR family transcriptional regulator
MTTPPPQPMPFERKTLPLDEKPACEFSRRLIQLFISETNRATPITYMDTFLMVACNESKSVSEYAEQAGVSKSVMSRHLLDIGDYFRSGVPGLGLVTSRPRIEDDRAHEILLTAKGRSLATRVRELLDQWTPTKSGG